MTTTRSPKNNANKSNVVSPLSIAKQQHIEKIIYDLFDLTDHQGYQEVLKKLLTVHKYTSGASAECIEDMECSVNRVLSTISKLETTMQEFKNLES